MSVADRLERARLGQTGEDYVGIARGCLAWANANELPRISRVPAIQALYAAMRQDGMQHALAEMLALQQPPMSNTDREFLEGRGGCYDQFDGNEYIGDYYAGMAKQAGVDTTGKVYQGSIAAYPGDPRAWVTGRGDVQKLLEERGWGSEGSVNVKMREAPEAPRKAIADDIVRDGVEAMAEALPPGEKVDREALSEQFVAQHKPYWAKE